MKRKLSLVLLLIIGLAAFSQGDSIRGKHFNLKGKIIENVQLTPDCGIVAWGTVVTFEVIELVGMKNAPNTIGIIITCPESYKDNFFKKGKTYQVVFANKNQADFRWTIPNKDLLKKNKFSFEPYAITIKELL